MSAVLDNSAPNRYFDRHFNRDAVKILPGEYYATRDNTVIVTVLGLFARSDYKNRRNEPLFTAQ